MTENKKAIKQVVTLILDMSVYIYIYIYIYIYTCTYIFNFTWLILHFNAYIYVYISLCVCNKKIDISKNTPWIKKFKNTDSFFFSKNVSQDAKIDDFYGILGDR